MYIVQRLIYSVPDCFEGSICCWTVSLQSAHHRVLLRTHYLGDFHRLMECQRSVLQTHWHVGGFILPRPLTLSLSRHFLVISSEGKLGRYDYLDRFVKLLLLLLLSYCLGFLHHILRKDYGTFRLFSGDENANEGEMFFRGLFSFVKGALTVCPFISSIFICRTRWEWDSFLVFLA